jgi:hypothetical protein
VLAHPHVRPAQARYLFGVIGYLQKRDGLRLRIVSGRRAGRVRRAA